MELSIFNRINSKYILKDIFSLAFSDMKSIFKLIKHNKKLMDKLGINIKKIEEHFQYNIKIETKKNGKFFFSMYLIKDIIVFIIFMIYLILYNERGKFNGIILPEEYDKGMKKFVDIMDKYILPIYFVIIIISIILNILLCLTKLFYLQNEEKQIFFLFSFIDLVHYVLNIIKKDFTNKIIKKGEDKLKYLYKKDSNLFWFEDFDTAIIAILPTIYIILSCVIAFKYREKRFFQVEDYKTVTVNQLNGINILDYSLPINFTNFSIKEKNEEIFKKDNMKKYQYKLQDNQISLITKINNIRNNYNMPMFKFNVVEKLPDFIINLKAELFFYPDKNIYKLSPNLYIFKYRKNEIHNLLNEDKLLNIVKNYFLEKINIIEQNNFYFISIYEGIVSNYINNINIRLPSIGLPNVTIANSEDRLKDTFENLEMTDIGEEEGNEVGEIRNIEVNKNAFEKYKNKNKY